MAETVGLVGLGLMGSALSGRLIKSGYRVLGYDVDKRRMKEFEERGGLPVDSPAAAAEATQFVVLSLLHGGIVREVCFGPDGILETAGENLVVIDTTTSSPEESATTAAMLRKSHVGFLDSGISGASRDAWEGKITALVGGEDSDFQSARTILEAIARTVHHVGPNGSGARMKLIVNLVLGLNRLVLAEGLVLAMKSEMDLDTVLAILKSTPAYSVEMDTRGQRMANGEYGDPISRIRQHHKDVRLMLEQGQRHGAPMLLCSVHQQLLQAAEMGGLGEADTSGTIEVLRRLAGIPTF